MEPRDDEFGTSDLSSVPVICYEIYCVHSFGTEDCCIFLKLVGSQSRLAPPSYSVVCYQIVSKNIHNGATSKMRSKYDVSW